MPVYPRPSTLQSPAVGSFFELVLSSWFPPYPGFHSSPVLVAHYGSRHPGLRSCLCGVQSKQDTPAGTLWSSSATSPTSSPLVHVSLDFVTGLPPSDGNTVILTVVDRFSKAAHFIPLPKLPSAKETAEIMVQHVFRMCLPVDICLIEGLSSPPSSGGPSVPSSEPPLACHRAITRSPMVSQNGRTRSSNPSTWSRNLVWVDARNTLPSVATGLSPFECSLGYQPPLFPDQEAEVAVPSAQLYVRRCRRAWCTGPSVTPPDFSQVPTAG